jgi:AbiTii
MASLIEELQQHALDRSIPVEDLLRKAWIAAEKLGLTEFSAWAKKELDGYDSSDAIPAYRRAHSEFQAYNPFHGWQSILWSDTTGIEQLFEPREITTAAGSLEQTADADTQALFILTADLKARLVASLEVPTDVRCLLNKSELLEIVGHIRNEILRWSVELERAGIVGEGLSFSKQEKEKAQRAEFHFHGVQNVSNVLGDVSEGGSVTINQQASQDVDPRALVDLAAQLRQNLDSLVPAAERARFAREIELIGAEAEAATPNVGRLKRALNATKEMIREGGKGAATSLITQGAIALIEGALKHL